MRTGDLDRAKLPSGIAIDTFFSVEKRTAGRYKVQP
jgi:hypothetical protein